MGCSTSKSMNYTFDQVVEKAKRKIEIETTATSSELFSSENHQRQQQNQNHQHQQQHTQEPHSGQYFVCYIDGYRNKNSMSVLSFTAATNAELFVVGYKISGRKVDVDGNSYIEDGFVRVKDGKCYWIERFTTGDNIGIRVLSKGVFNFYKQEFVGSWETSSRRKGKYTSFQANLPSENTNNTGAVAIATLITEESTSQQQQEQVQQQQQQQEQYQDIIPLVMAKIEDSYKSKKYKVSSFKNNDNVNNLIYYPNGARCRRQYCDGRGSEAIAYAMPVRQ